MSILYILLTILMFLDCILLVFLVLLQLPKKEAGAGMAFGGAATDALFGAGSGNVLTKVTKYVAGIFFGLAILMALMAAHKPPSSAVNLTQKLLQGSPAPLMAPPTTPQQPAPSAAAPGTGLLQLSNLPAVSSNAAAAPARPSSPPPASTVKTNK